MRRIGVASCGEGKVGSGHGLSLEYRRLGLAGLAC
jgi:hypothetical protein